MHAAYAGNPYRVENKNNLREVSTVFSVERLNEARHRGQICIIRTLKKNPELKISSILLRNRRTGEYVVTPSREVYLQYGKGVEIYSAADWLRIQEIDGYARAIRHESNWGAYVVPSDANVGERLFIGELIEDLVANKFWYTISSAESAEAIWDGTDLEIDHQSYQYELIG